MVGPIHSVIHLWLVVEIRRQVKRVLSWQFKEEEELIVSLHQIKQVLLCAPEPYSLFALEFMSRGIYHIFPF